MPVIVFSRIMRTAAIELIPHGMLDANGIVAFGDEIVLVEHVAEEVAVIDRLSDLADKVRRKVLEPVAVIAAKRDVERDDFFDLVRVQCAVADRRARDCEPVLECLLGLSGVHSKASLLLPGNAPSAFLASSIPSPSTLRIRWC